MNEIIDLTGSWEFTVDWRSSNISELPQGLISSTKWMAAEVPGTVHTDLLANNKIEDPFYRDNELKVQWVSKVGWIYRREFYVPEKMLSLDVVQLVAEGLDTFSTVFINGHEIAQTQNMFIKHRIDVKQYLHPGENEIKIEFDSPVLRSKRYEDTYGKLPASHEDYRVYARKAQYSFGWDWGPKLPTSGIWRPICIEAFDSIRIEDVQVETNLNKSLTRARLSVHIKTEIFSRNVVSLTATVVLNGEKKEFEIHDPVFTLPLEIVKPELWWPTGLGEQPLYQLDIQIYADSKIADARSIRFGIRKVELLQEEDKWGQSFSFKINHKPIFCKGANWIPVDNFIPRVSQEEYRELLEAAKNANMNMLRIWGGGIYEEEIFYELCDELGLLVWQDFMFACGAYPDHDEFKANVSQEAESVIKRLRNHPSVIIWCGNNENEWIWKRDTGKPLKEMPGYSLFHNLIPSICKKLDPSRPYWPSSPFGGEDPNSADEGNRHQWGIWSGWEDFTAVEDDGGRFISEFGFQAPANFSTFEKVTAPEDRSPQSEIMEFHNKQEEGTNRLARFLAAHVQMPTTYEDFIYKGQIIQGEALKYCIEHWRRKMFRTSGALIWQLNDCWPVSSWSLIDSDLKPKAAYYYVKKAFMPVLVSLTQNEEKIEVWITNDTMNAWQVILKLSCMDFDGEIDFTKNIELNVRGNSSFKACELNRQELEITSTVSQYLKAELLVESKVVSENRLFFERIKDLKIPKSIIQKKLEKMDERKYVLKLRSSHFAKSVRVETDFNTQIDDNYFDLEANSQKTVNIFLMENKKLAVDDILVHSLSNSVLFLVAPN